MSKIVVTVTGPSASGKTELVNNLCKLHGFSKLVSVTTRPPREGEVEGIEYYFISEDRFKELKDDGKLVQEVNFNGKHYATTAEEIDKVLAGGGIPIVIVEPGGVGQFKKAGEKFGFKVFSVYVYAPYVVLKQRFLDRLGGKNATDYDTIRLTAISKESLEWIDLLEWDLIVGNSKNDLSEIEWHSKNVVEAVDGFVVDLEKQEKANGQS